MGEPPATAGGQRPAIEAAVPRAHVENCCSNPWSPTWAIKSFPIRATSKSLEQVLKRGSISRKAGEAAGVERPSPPAVGCQGRPAITKEGNAQG